MNADSINQNEQRSLRPVLVAVLGLCFSVVHLAGYAQDIANSPEPQIRAIMDDGQAFIAEFDIAHSFVEGDHRIALLHGNVHIIYGATNLWADSVVLWYDDTESKFLPRTIEPDDFRYDYLIPGTDSPAKNAPLISPGTNPLIPGASEPLELYAEGHIKITQDENTVFCEQVYTHLSEKRGIIVKGEIYSAADLSGKKHPLHIGFSSIKQIYTDLALIEDAYFTTCTFGVPHYEVHAEKCLLIGNSSQGRLEFEDPYIKAGFISISLPDTSVDIGRRWYFPVRRIKAGSSSRFGPYLLTTLEEDFDALGNKAHSALGIDTPFRGNMLLDLDLYSKRGVGIGPGIEYGADGLYEGFLKGYFINDSHDEDRGDIPIDENKRGRVKTQNRIHLWEHTLLDLELSYITDFHFMDEYYEEELKEEKEQETYLYLHDTNGSNSFSLLNRFRLNDFDSQLEYLPQGIWETSPIAALGGRGASPFLGFLELSGIFYSHRTELSQVRNRPADDLDIRSDRLFRADYLSTLEAPFKILNLKINPYLENRVSYFERGLGESRSQNRVVETFGVQSGFLLHSTSDFTSEMLNIHGLRNILEPSVEYRNTFAINKDQQDLIRFDELENPMRGEIVFLNLRQRLQTHKDRQSDEIHTLYEGLFSLPLYPDRRYSENGHKMGNLSFETFMTPLLKQKLFKNIQLIEEGEYNLNDGRMDILNSGLTMNPNPDLGLGLWHRWIRDRYSFMGMQVTTLLTDKWEAGFGIYYNIEEKEWADKTVSLRRRAHQWLFEIRATVDEGDDNKSLYLMISPLAFFSGKSEGTLYEPMRGN